MGRTKLQRVPYRASGHQRGCRRGRGDTMDLGRRAGPRMPASATSTFIGQILRGPLAGGLQRCIYSCQWGRAGGGSPAAGPGCVQAAPADLCVPLVGGARTRGRSGARTGPDPSKSDGRAAGGRRRSTAGPGLERAGADAAVGR